MRKHGIILFDGVCNVCNGYVQFVIERDPKGYFQFASLQSEAGQALLQEYNLPTDTMDTIVLIDEGKAYTHSSVPLRVAGKLSGAWKLGKGLLIVPPSVRNAVYRFVAKNRYKWFGKQESCMLPTPAIRQRFI
mgnify:CR=1 FL=1